ncbi:hypothetical protein X777_00594 [Ooceraea biroi]|uniref:Uncharacterized protein n=1 Tax=Ooceraea biroi TaxID=2015173 RepID=A0A026X2J6_OOCBI|nr:hypothetical protein X777_00594 [Ooceraea biroi]
MSARRGYPSPTKKIVLRESPRDGERPRRSWSRSRCHPEGHLRLPPYSRRPYDLTTASRFLTRCCSCPLTEVGGAGGGGDDVGVDDSATRSQRLTTQRRGGGPLL